MFDLPSTQQTLDTAATAIKAGDISGGKKMLDQVLAIEPRNTLALLWMTKCTDDPRERAALFQQVLEIDPGNSHALKGIELYRDHSPRAPVPRPTAVPEASPVSIPAATTDISEPTKSCPYCAETIKAAAVVCRYCGKALTNVSEAMGGRFDGLTGILEQRVSLYIREGYTIVTHSSTVVTLKAPKEFNWIAFLIFFGLLYLIYYFVQTEEQVTLRLLANGSVEESGYSLRVLESDERGQRTASLVIVGLVLLLVVLCVIGSFQSG